MSYLIRVTGNGTDYIGRAGYFVEKDDAEAGYPYYHTAREECHIRRQWAKDVGEDFDFDVWSVEDQNVVYC